jgi:endonuclease/exonuclease/phosphatase family metal-dependent hydrolase
VQLRLATFNIRHGRVSRHLPCLPWRLSEGVRRLDADIVGLQEVDRRVFRSWFGAQVAIARRALDADAGAFAHARWFGGGHYGNGLAVRGSITHSRTVELPHRPGREPRVALMALVDTHGIAVHVAVTHLQNEVSQAIDQLQFLTDLLASEPAPKVLLGDLNLDTEDVAPIVQAAGLTLASGGNSSGIDRPWHRIDHIAVAGMVIDEVKLPRPPVSDHRPVIATVRVERMAPAVKPS